MEIEHAPGPWRVEPHDNYIPENWDEYPVQVVDADDNVVACNAAFYPTSLRPNNAPIIAAAPEMLEALRNVNKLISEAAMAGFNWQDGDWAERLFHSQQKTSNAIRKAEGLS